MRYERRDPRPEDLRDIEELKSRIEAQDRDLCRLTEKLRELQNQQQHQSQTVSQQQQQRNTNNANNSKSANNKQQPKQQQQSKGHQTSNKQSSVNMINVIYEENEERDASPPAKTVSAPALTAAGESSI